MRNLFILLFLLANVLQFTHQRQDWPLSRFGMYSEMVSKGEKCIFHVSAWANLENQKVKVRLPDRYRVLAWFYSQNCKEMLNGNWEVSQSMDIGIRKEVEAASLAAPQSSDSVQIRVELNYWQELTADKIHNPDQQIVVYGHKLDRR